MAGHAGKSVRPLHPPFAHFPIAAYVLAAGFDVVSLIAGSGHPFAGQLWHAGTFVLIAGLAICLVTMFTGFADLVRFGEDRTPVLRIMAVHVCIQSAVFMLGVVDVAIRVRDYHQASTPWVVVILTLAAAVGVCAGGFFGGTMVYEHGSGVSAQRPPVPQSLPAPAGTPEPRSAVGRWRRDKPVTRHRVRGR